MGNRANVQVVFSKTDPGVFLYTHWGRNAVPQQVQAVLRRKCRWDDASYLARMLFCAMVGEDTEGETGFGISAQPVDGTDYVLCVNVEEKTVTRLPYSSKWCNYAEQRFTFQQFCDLDIEEFNWRATA